MKTYVIQVLEPGKKNRKMYAGGGQITSKWIHATQYRANSVEAKFEIDSMVAWMNENNPGYEFRLKEITGTGYDMYRDQRFTA